MKFITNYLKRRAYRKTQRWLKRKVKESTRLHIKLLAGTISTRI